MGKNTKPEREETLEDHGIFIQNQLVLEHCPKDLRDLFQLIDDVKDVKMEKFGRLKVHSASSGIANPRIEAAHQYDKWLKDRAEDLATSCSNDDLNDVSEAEWVGLLKPLVFVKFNIDNEERVEFHHCFICRCHFPPENRPSLIRLSKRNHREFPEGIEICQCQAKHLNLPNITSRMELAWHDEHTGEEPKSTNVEAKSRNKMGTERPDMTFGLRSYNLEKQPWTDRPDLSELDPVRLFDISLLQRIKKHFEFRELYRRSGTRPSDTTPQFPFALWEAKSASSNTNHLRAELQSAPKIQALLRYQLLVHEKSDVPGIPLCWYFSSVGYSWKVFGCYTESTPNSEKPLRYVLQHLWYGEVNNNDKALQLLYIMDMVAIWADHSYKPSICSCLRKLHTLVDGSQVAERGSDGTVERRELNRTNFPWLLNTNWNSPSQEGVNGNTIQLSGKINGWRPSRPDTPDESRLQKDRFAARSSPRLSVNPLERSHSKSPHRGRTNQSSSHLALPYQSLVGRSVSTNPASSTSDTCSPTSSEGSYITPELHNYIWILDRDPGSKELLVLSIDRKGNIMDPLIVHESDQLKHKQFSLILGSERTRCNKAVDSRFLFDKNGQHYLRRLVLEDLIDPSRRETQFCAILPLDNRLYLEQRDEMRKREDVFRSIEQLLRIEDLLLAIQRFRNRWCISECLVNKIWNEYSPNMILCDNASCKIRWYHLKCLDMDEDYGSDERWLCPECGELPESAIIYAKDGNVDYDDDLYEESTFRIQLTHAVDEAFRKHKWPTKTKIWRKLDRLSCKVDIDSSVQYSIPPEGNVEERAPPGCWAVLKDPCTEPKMTKISFRGPGYAISRGRANKYSK